MSEVAHRLYQYMRLMRLHKPIGIFLLMWPTLWALWLASFGYPDRKILLLFILGVVLMRSAGCVFNDLVDRHIDGHVKRTRDRPLVTGKVTPREAYILFTLLSSCAVGCVLLCNTLTIKLAWIGAFWVIFYPFLKRITHFPQLGIGIAFSWGIPMAFAACTNMVSLPAWFLFAIGVLWSIIYDTVYAMIDRDDDIKIGVKSTAILFSHLDTFIIGLLQFLLMVMLIIVGLMFKLTQAYYFSLLIVTVLFLYQQWLIKNRDPEMCMRVFLNNNCVGMVIFLGIAASYW